MDISPQRVRTADFRTVKRGLDPDEVRSFLNDVATELERAQNQSTAMEARARAAVARLQEISDGTSAGAPAKATESKEQPAEAGVSASVDEAETISRTLLLAQRTADTTVADAQAEADRILKGATDEASATLDSTREMSARLLEEARVEARRAGDEERLHVQNAVEMLLSRRVLLESDVEMIEQHLADERSRLREAATSLLELTERVPGGMGEVGRPAVSDLGDDLGPGVQTSMLDEPPTSGEMVTDAIDVTVADDAATADDASAGADEAADDDDGLGIAMSDDGVDIAVADDGGDESPDDTLVIQTDLSDDIDPLLSND